MVACLRHHLPGGVVIFSTGRRRLLGLCLGMKIPLGDRLNEIGVRGRHLLPEGFVVVPSSLCHPRLRPASVFGVVVPGVVGVCAVRELLLRHCFGPSNSDVGAAVVVGVVVAWPSSVTDVAFGSTSGSRCRACDAPSRMLCRAGLGGRPVAFLVASSPPRLHLLG
jgi:hypothetical protein